MNTKINKQDISSFLKEIIVVVLGVLIAVSINNYKQHSDNQKYIDKTLAAIENEIQQSKIEVEKILQGHLQIADSIYLSFDKEYETVSQMILRLGGLQGAETKNIGLRFFIANKAELVDYEIISHLSEIESTSILLDKKMDRLLDFTYDIVDKKDTGSKRKFLIYLGNVIDSEDKLLNLYDAFLNKHQAVLSAE